MDARELIRKEQQRVQEETKRQKIERERRLKLDEAFSRKFSGEAMAAHKKAKKEARKRELLQIKSDLLGKILRENYPELFRQDDIVSKIKKNRRLLKKN